MTSDEIKQIVRYTSHVHKLHSFIKPLMSNEPFDEDKALFHQAMRNVKPLQSSTKRESVVSTAQTNEKHRSTPFKSNALPSRKSDPTTKKSHDTTYYDPSFASFSQTDTVQAHSILSFHRQGFPKKRLNALKKGLIPWEARLDLHGLNSDKAQDALCQFIESQHRLNHRSLLIIHGKGGRHGEAPVLKNLVNAWLQRLPLVIAFHSAEPRDGGQGALYVLLKRVAVTYK